MKIFLKLWQKDLGRPIRRSSVNPRRIGQILGRANFQKAYLRVVYPELKAQYSGADLPSNEGEYFTKEELRMAFKAFTEIQ